MRTHARMYTHAHTYACTYTHTYAHNVHLQAYIYTRKYLLSMSVFAIVARSSREMSLTVRIVWKHIMSRVRVSVRPSNFVYAKNIQNLGEIGSSARVFISMTRYRLWMPAEQAVAVGRQLIALTCTVAATVVRVCVRVLVCACVCVSVCVLAHACARLQYYDHNIWPRLIMIIIKIIS